MSAHDAATKLLADALMLGERDVPADARLGRLEQWDSLAHARLLLALEEKLRRQLTTDEAVAVVERAAAAYAIQPGELVLGTDNGSAFTARRFRSRLAALGIKHRRGGYRDPESQAFIESWFGKLKEREVWLNEYETLDQARAAIGGYIDRYHHRPHSGLSYRTPDEVRRTWEDHQRLQKQAA